MGDNIFLKSKGMGKTGEHRNGRLSLFFHDIRAGSLRLEFGMRGAVRVSGFVIQVMCAFDSFDMWVGALETSFAGGVKAFVGVGSVYNSADS